MTAPLPPRTTRRGALAATLVAVVGTGCEATSPTAPPPGSGPGQDPTGRITTVPEDPDEALVVDVRADLVDASLLIAAAVAARPGLRRELAGFTTLHAHHLRAIDGERVRGRTPPVSGDADAVRRVVRAREEQLRASLADAAVAAQSGQLAALLASMSAAVAQRLGVGETGVSR